MPPTAAPADPLDLIRDAVKAAVEPRLARFVETLSAAHPSLVSAVGFSEGGDTVAYSYVVTRWAEKHLLTGVWITTRDGLAMSIGADIRHAVSGECYLEIPPLPIDRDFGPDAIGYIAGSTADALIQIALCAEIFELPS